MPVSTGQLVARGVTNRCPNCGGSTLFGRWFKAQDRCARCDLRFEREEGFFLGAVVINYTVTTVLMLAPIAVLVFRETVSVPTAITLAIGWCIIFPVLFYPWSKSLWLMTYYLFMRHQLPGLRIED